MIKIVGEKLALRQRNRRTILPLRQTWAKRMDSTMLVLSWCLLMLIRKKAPFTRRDFFSPRASKMLKHLSQARTITTAIVVRVSVVVFTDVKLLVSPGSESCSLTTSSQVGRGEKITMNFLLDTSPKIRDTKFQPIIFPHISNIETNVYAEGQIPIGKFFQVMVDHYR